MVRSSWDNLILRRIWIKILVLNSIFWLYLSDTTCIMYVMTLNFPSHSPFTITEKMLISCWYPYIVLVSYTVYLHLQGMKVSDKLSSTIAINLDHYPFLHQDLQQIIIQTEDQLWVKEPRQIMTFSWSCEVCCHLVNKLSLLIMKHTHKSAWTWNCY